MIEMQTSASQSYSEYRELTNKSINSDTNDLIAKIVGSSMIHEDKINALFNVKNEIDKMLFKLK